MATNGVLQPDGVWRDVVPFAVDGDIKYLSHQDTIRMFARALARARIPVRFSQGFNPHPRIAIPLPRPVGVASDAERLVLELTDAVAPADLTARLQPQMPQGLRLGDGWLLGPRDACVPVRVVYRVDAPAVDPSTLRAAIDRLLASETVPVPRYAGAKSPPKRVDIRPFIARIEALSDGVLLDFHVTGRGSARPDEVCRLLGIQDEGILDRTRRIEVEWQ